MATQTYALIYRRPRHLAIAAALGFLLLTPLTASAYNMGPESIQISPEDPILAGEAIGISISLSTPTSSAIFTGPTTWSVTGNTISIDVHAATQ